jgi:monothiol glutaredoxin
LGSNRKSGCLVEQSFVSSLNFWFTLPIHLQNNQQSAMTPELQERLDTLVQQNKILLFMKGNKLMPQCGFSNNAVQILNTLGVPYETIDVLDDYEIRQGIKEYSNWPTIPQIYINGQFVGGSDILIELYQKGELQQLVEVALAS